MAVQKINFFQEEIKYPVKDKALLRAWITDTLRAEGKSLGDLNFIFCTDSYLLSINQQYLDHNTYTDIITFDNGGIENQVAGDIFISVDRIRENASLFGVSEREELHRVIIHGTLHLVGYGDKSVKDKKLMTSKEDQYLALRTF
ncbi:rRNA maturation RNase YbeY [Hufsiella ginkgonis]|uniref:Endoribonuclease YbeY n=1 Tax=Hufsiella ginkgonis TaxID=2695274 RepID=A0A7K1XUM5_9SPHI|nr:rRNA maturation RNase YbeY [Hufsiella ginkgonis]MXV14715.1 rRNA maturation RNase YbeY [Hufsiella ginkgonis]